MRQYFFIAIFLFLRFIDASQADTHVMLAGGGCEVAMMASDNDFFPEFREAQKEYKRLGVSLTTMFGNEGATELQADAFTEEKFWQALEKLKTQSWPVDSQFLLQINTHGGQETDKNQHTICVSEINAKGEVLKSYIPISKVVDKLKEIKQAAPQLKIALIDNSCYGGKAVEYAQNEGLCVLSSTTPLSQAEFRGYFNFQFLRQAQKGQSMSQAYVQAILNDKKIKVRSNRDIPMINSLKPEIINNFINISELITKLENDLGYVPIISQLIFETDDPENPEAEYEEVEEEKEEEKTPQKILTERLNGLSAITSESMKSRLSWLSQNGPQSRAFQKTIQRMEKRIKKIEDNWPKYFIATLSNWDVIKGHSSTTWLSCSHSGQRAFSKEDIKKSEDVWTNEIDKDLTKYFRDLYFLRQQLDEYFQYNLEKLGEDGIFAGPEKSTCDDWKF